MLRHKGLIALAVLFAFPSVGMAQTSATETGYAYATVEQIPITLTLNQSLHFGRFAPWGSAGWINISPTSSPSASGSHVTILDQGYPALWTVTGTPNAPFTVLLPADRTVVMTSGSGAGTMTIEYFVSSYHETGTSPILSSAGTTSFKLGGKVLIGANQSPGFYTGTFPVTVAY